MPKGFITRQFSIASGSRPTDASHSGATDLVPSSEQPAKTQAITLRPVQPEDDPFLLEVYASTRADEMALVPWNEEQRLAFVSSQFAAQQSYYAEKYPDAEHSIIVKNGKDVGRLYLARLPEELHIADITVVPAERNGGVGSFLLKELIEEARESEKTMTIYVEIYNPSRRLFERLGFSTVEEQGMHLLLHWPAKVED